MLNAHLPNNTQSNSPLSASKAALRDKHLIPRTNHPVDLREIFGEEPIHNIPIYSEGKVSPEKQAASVLIKFEKYDVVMLRARNVAIGTAETVADIVTANHLDITIHSKEAWRARVDRNGTMVYVTNARIVLVKGSSTRL